MSPCRSCGASVEAGNRFCTSCGAPMPEAAPAPAPAAAAAPASEGTAAVTKASGPTDCPACGRPVAAGRRFCTGCGAKLTSAEAPAPARVDSVGTPAPDRVYASATGEIGAVPLFQRAYRQPSEWLSRNLLLMLNWETVAYLAILVAAILSRFLFLGERPVHHDESIHADSSYNLFRLRGYSYDPGYHGPLLYHFTALGYFLFGVSDWTARVFPSLLGVALVMSPIFFRDFLGRTGALIAAVFFLTEGSIVYYSRFLRDTIYLELANVVMTLALFRWLREKRDLWLYVGGVALAVSFTTMEATYLTIAVFGGFMAAWGAYECFVAKRRDFSRWVAEFRESLVRDRRWLIGPRFEWMEPFRDTLTLIALAICLGVVSLLVVQFAGPARLLRIVYFALGTGAVLSLGSLGVVLVAGAVVLVYKSVLAAVLVMLGISAAYLLLNFFFCRPRAIYFASLLFALIYVLFFSTLFTNLKGLADGITWSLTYWQDQHYVERGSQPPYLYVYIMLAYDIPLLILGAMGAYHYMDKRHTLAKWFVWWAAASFLVYSYAGERMPWLVMHVTVPACLFAALYLGKMIDWRSRPGIRATGIAGAVASVLFFLHGGWDFTFRRPVDPRDLLIQVQTSNDVLWVANDVEKMNYRYSGERKDLPFLAAGSANWPFPWYFRDYNRFGYAELVTAGHIKDDEPHVIIAPWTDLERLKSVVGDKYEIKRYRERLWWDPDFGQIVPGWRGTRRFSEVPGMLLFAAWTKMDVRKVWDYWMYREVFSITGSEDMIVLYRRKYPQKFDQDEATLLRRTY